MNNINKPVSKSRPNNSTFKALYDRWGFSLIVLKGKIPLEPNWQQWCAQRRDFNAIPFKTDNNAGIACGPASGILVVDVDNSEAFKSAYLQNKWELPETLTIKTGGGGRHYYFKYPEDSYDYGNRALKKYGFDIRGVGGQVVAPGSIHPDSGKEYTIENDLPIAPPPDWLLALAIKEEPQKTLPVKKKSVKAPVVKTKVEDLPVDKHIQTLITKGKLKGQRSEAIITVLNALVMSDVPNSDIFALFETYPIGEKYLEKGQSKERWLQEQIDNAKAYTSKCTSPENERTPDIANPIEFPYHIIDGVAGEFAKLLSSHTESPIEFYYLTFLSCLGCALADKLTIATELHPQPRLYVLLLGHSADDRKSTAINKTIELFGNRISVCYGVGSAEGLQRVLKNGSNLLLCHDEFQQFVGKASIQSSVLLPCVNTLFELNHYESHTKESGISLHDVALSMLSASTIDTYERTWSPSFTAIGFNNRLFIVPGHGSRKYPLPKVIPIDEKIKIIQALDKIIMTVGTKCELTISNDALDKYSSWYMKLEPSIHSRRLDTYAMRFMSLLAVNNDLQLIDSGTVEKVIDLMDWQLKVRQFYDPIDADNEMAKMEEKIRKQLSHRGPLSDRDLHRFTGAHRTGLWIFKRAIGNLEQAGEVIFNNTTKRRELKEK